MRSADLHRLGIIKGARIIAVEAEYRIHDARISHRMGERHLYQEFPTNRLDFDIGAAKVIAGYSGTIGGSASEHIAQIAFQLKF